MTSGKWLRRLETVTTAAIAVVPVPLGAGRGCKGKRRLLKRRLFPGTKSLPGRAI